MPGDVDYERAGTGYSTHRRADPRIEGVVHAALGDARSVVNVGAGCGSYEPRDRAVVAVEPSAAMRRQRPDGRVPVVAGYAEALPFRTGAFDAAMAMVTAHQWTDLEAGLHELRRVARRVVVLTFDPHALESSWLHEYAPEVTAVERRRMPSIERCRAALGAATTVVPIPIPADCTDGFGEAFFGRPERMLDPAVRAAQSAWSFVGRDAEERFAERLGVDLASGRWDERHGHLRTLAAYEGSLRLVVAPGDPPADPLHTS
jgi:hypothetical protein